MRGGLRFTREAAGIIITWVIWHHYGLTGVLILTVVAAALAALFLAVKFWREDRKSLR